MGGHRNIFVTDIPPKNDVVLAIPSAERLRAKRLLPSSTPRRTLLCLLPLFHISLAEGFKDTVPLLEVLGCHAKSVGALELCAATPAIFGDAVDAWWRGIGREVGVAIRAVLIAVNGKLKDLRSRGETDLRETRKGKARR